MTSGLTIVNYLGRLRGHGYHDMQSEFCSGLASLIFSDAGKRSVVLDRGRGEEELALLGGGRARVDVEVVAHVNLVHQGRSVIYWRVTVLPRYSGLRNGLQRNKNALLYCNCNAHMYGMLVCVSRKCITSIGCQVLWLLPCPL